MYGCNLCWVVIAQMRKDAYVWNLNSDALFPKKKVRNIKGVMI